VGLPLVLEPKEEGISVLSKIGFMWEAIDVHVGPFIRFVLKARKVFCGSNHGIASALVRV
jgi:hypothetical protein